MRTRVLLLFPSLLGGCSASAPATTTPAIVASAPPSPAPSPPVVIADPRVLSCAVSQPVGDLRSAPPDDAWAGQRAKRAPPSAGAPMVRQVPQPPLPVPTPTPLPPVPPPPPPPPPPSRPTFVLIADAPRSSSGVLPSSTTAGLSAAGAEVCSSLAGQGDVGPHTLELAMDARGTAQVRLGDDVPAPSPYLHCVMQRACQVTASADAAGKPLFLPFRVAIETPPPMPPPPPMALVDVSTVRTTGDAGDKIATEVRGWVTRAAQRCAEGVELPEGASVVFQLKLADNPQISSLDDPNGTSGLLGLAFPRSSPRAMPRRPPPPVRPRTSLLRVTGVTTQTQKGAPRQLLACMVSDLGTQSIVVSPAETKPRVEAVKVTWPDGTPR